MAGSLYTSSPQIKAHLRKGMRLLTPRAGARVLMDANRGVPQPSLSRGYSMGALKASGHVVEEGKGTANYDAAIADAKLVDGGKLLRRDQIIPPRALLLQRSRSTSFVDYPLTYAALMEHGFFHRKAKRHIIGVHFLLSAVNINEDWYFSEVGYLLKELEEIEPLTPAQLVQLAIDRAQRREMRHARSQMQGLSLQDMVDRSGEKLERLSYGKGDRKFYETYGEMWERIKTNAQSRPFFND